MQFVLYYMIDTLLTLCVPVQHWMAFYSVLDVTPGAVNPFRNFRYSQKIRCRVSPLQGLSYRSSGWSLKWICATESQSFRALNRSPCTLLVNPDVHFLEVKTQLLSPTSLKVSNVRNIQCRSKKTEKRFESMDICQKFNNNIEGNWWKGGSLRNISSPRVETMKNRRYSEKFDMIKFKFSVYSWIVS